jgi:hypothetical protein
MSANDVLYWCETCLPHSWGNTESENVREQYAGAYEAGGSKRLE